MYRHYNGRRSLSLRKRSILSLQPSLIFSPSPLFIGGVEREPETLEGGERLY